MHDKLSRLIDRLFRKMIVPFLGAGVSYNADPDGLTRTPDMIRRLAQKLILEAEKSIELAKFLLCICGKQDGTEVDLCIDKLCNAGMAVLAEVYIHLHNEVKACNILRVAEFCDLEPTPTHCYIAYIAREGYINEIITTNYDTCMEKAYEKSFNRNFTSRQVRVVTNLSEYRHFIDDSNPKYPLLHIYKINGCAKKFKEDPQNEAANIVLTERQLQNWRENKWAQDMFRDRCRTRSILFSGFGSEEPQIRHTVLQVMDEFINNGQNSGNNVEVWDYENSPFIAEWGEMTFYQFQILSSYLRAHGLTQITINEVQEGAFTKSDKELFDRYLPWNGKNLEMEQFWGVVYLLFIQRLLSEKYFSPGSKFSNYLPISLSIQQLLLQEFRQEILGQGGNEFKLQDLFIWDQKVSNLQASALHHRILFPGEELEPYNYYAFRDEPVALCMLYFLWWLCYRAYNYKDKSWLLLCAEGKALVRIFVAEDNNIKIPVYVCGRDGYYNLSQLVMDDKLPYSLGLIFVLNGYGLEPKVFPISNIIDSQLDIIQFYIIPDVYCFSNSCQSLEDILEGIRNLITDPAKIKREAVHWKKWVEETYQ
ncbi:SIR2 family NAD-dependent protein deacylase [Neomoorella thermoacetica]|uniref:SIR2 family NAD-dependent protein deacylase n=1 Tax=Neomoorella thermoacetica TaxID=1525 RepID=UPI0009227BE1|nr:SIR2 family protein [Moorella thermoacetica]OIQ52730.1 hypothetical protein MORE_26190 [Moorella thermoacetica]